MDNLDVTLQNIPKTLRTDVCQLVPFSLLPTLTCCVMYDEHPRDKKKIDITVCLHEGRVVELYQRECVSSIKLPDVCNIKEIQIVRNSKGELFYLVRAAHEVIILSNKDQISVHRRFPNVLAYEICDPLCSGDVKLMIKTESSISYMSFDNNINESSEVNRDLENTKPVINALAKKLTEAKYNLQSSEEAYKQIEKLRQHASFLYHGDDVLQMKTPKPIVRFCNKQIVIQLEIENPFNESMNKVCILFHNNSCNSISYTSIVYQHIATSPFYKEIEFREIKSKSEASVVAVIPIREFRSSISSRIEFSVIYSYERLEKRYLQSFDNVQITAADLMGNNFDVFNSSEIDEHGMCLAMLSTTSKTILCVKQKGLGEMISPSNIFSKYLKMDLLGEKKTVAIHKQSPYHILHGMMIIFDDNHERIDVKRNEINYNIDVYTRSPSQVLALIHFIYDQVPLTLTVTTPNIQVTSHEDSDEVTSHNKLNFNYTECAKSLLKQSTMTLEYLDNCLKEMNKSNNMDRLSTSDSFQIDLFAMGREAFVKYRNSMLAEATDGIEHLYKSFTQTCDKEDLMETE